MAHMSQHQFPQCSNTAHKNYMKPLSQLTAIRRSHRGEESPAGPGPTHPVTDFHFQAPAGELRGANDRLRVAPPVLGPSFRDLSSEFFATEMKRDYVAEASLFAIIVSISAWPMILMIQAMGQLGK
jgi:hypothetical protein